MRRRVLTIALLLFPISAVSLILISSAADGGAVRCDKFAGADTSGGHGATRHGRGSRKRPFKTIHELDAALAPGQTGCLLGGTYGSTSAVHALEKSGRPGHRITITADPGARATVVGWMQIDGAYTTVSGLNIDGSNSLYTRQRPGTNCPYPVSQGLSIAGAHDVFEYNNYYQSVPSLRGNGIGIGWIGQPNDTIVRYNRIHDLGQCLDFDHMVYLAAGNNVQIYDNWLWNDAHGWGVQIYPGPQNALIHGNVIDGAGSGFVIGDEGNGATSGNRVYENVVINSKGLDVLPRGVLISSPGLSGAGNRVVRNDSFHNPGGIANTNGVSTSKLSVARNIKADPHFVNASAHDFRLRPGSPLRRWRLWDGRQR